MESFEIMKDIFGYLLLVGVLAIAYRFLLIIINMLLLPFNVLLNIYLFLTPEKNKSTGPVSNDLSVDLSSKPAYKDSYQMRTFEIEGKIKSRAEHRFIAEAILKRELKNSEIVHHINGVKLDNRIENLCVMNFKCHEFHHDHLHDYKDKNGKYPSKPHQRNMLRKFTSSILLEDLLS